MDSLQTDLLYYSRMGKQPQRTIYIPVSLVAQLEAWGRLTAKLFQELSRAGLRPQSIPDDQIWYWADRWQQWERQADEDMASGRVKEFRGVNEPVADVNACGG